MPARYQKQKIRKRHRMRQPRRQCMARQMIDRDQGFARAHRQALGHGQPHHHAADQSRPGGDGNGINVFQ